MFYVIVVLGYIMFYVFSYCLVCVLEVVRALQDEDGVAVEPRVEGPRLPRGRTFLVSIFFVIYIYTYIHVYIYIYIHILLVLILPQGRR